MRKLFYLLVLTMLVSCNNTSNNKADFKLSRDNNNKLKYFVEDYSKMHEISINPKDTSVFLDSVISDIRFIKLETNENCLIGRINKILFSDSLIFILDKSNALAIFIFDFNGKFITKVSQRGKGPSEYIEINDIQIDTAKKLIAIIDVSMHKIIYYNFKGQYISYKKIPFSFYAYAQIDSSTIACYTGRANNSKIRSINNHMLVTTSLDWDPITRGDFIPKVFRTFNYEYSHPPLYEYGNNIFYSPRFSDIIYAVTKDTLYGAYFINMQGRSIPTEVKQIMNNRDFKTISTKYSFFNGKFIDFKNFAYIEMSTPQGGINIFYSKSTKNILSGYWINYHKPTLWAFAPPITRLGENTMVSIQEPKQILQFKKPFYSIIEAYKSSDKKEKASEKLKADKLFDGLKENDNPVLVFSTLRDF